MKSLYIASSHSFQEQPQLEKPSGDKYRLMEDYKEDQRDYDRYIANLRLIPCRPSDKWEEGVLYEEGKDYKVEPISVLKRLPVEIEGSDLTRRRIDHVIPITSSPIK